jgi:hypothetical protein
MKHLRPLVVAAALLCATAAKAYVTPGAVTLDKLEPSSAPANYDLHFGSRPAAIFLDYHDGQFTHWSQTADGNALIVLAHPGDLVTSATIQDASAWRAFYNNPAIGTDFYIAGMTQTGLSDVGEPSAGNGNPLVTRFGWAHIGLNPAGTFTVLDSAMAYGERGIVVGTTQAIPEPSTLAMMLLGLGFAGLHARRKTKS